MSNINAIPEVKPVVDETMPEQKRTRSKKGHEHRVNAGIYTLLVVLLGFVMFRADTVGRGFALLGTMFSFASAPTGRRRSTPPNPARSSTFCPCPTARSSARRTPHILSLAIIEGTRGTRLL